MARYGMRVLKAGESGTVKAMDGMTLIVATDDDYDLDDFEGL